MQKAEELLYFHNHNCGFSQPGSRIADRGWGHIAEGH